MAERKGPLAGFHVAHNGTHVFLRSSQQVLPAGLRPVPYPEEEGRKEFAAGCPSYGSFLNVRGAHVCLHTPSDTLAGDVTLAASTSTKARSSTHARKL